MTIKEVRRRHNQYVANDCPELQDFQRNAVLQLEWHILDCLKDQLGPGVSFEWANGCCGDPLKVLGGYAADIVVIVPTDEPGNSKTYNGFVWAGLDGSIHMELEYREDVKF